MDANRMPRAPKPSLYASVPQLFHFHPWKISYRFPQATIVWFVFLILDWFVNSLEIIPAMIECCQMNYSDLDKHFGKWVNIPLRRRHPETWEVSTRQIYFRRELCLIGDLFKFNRMFTIDVCFPHAGDQLYCIYIVYV